MVTSPKGQAAWAQSRKPDNRTDPIAAPRTKPAARNAASPLRSPLALQPAEARAAGALGKRRGDEYHCPSGRRGTLPEPSAELIANPSVDKIFLKQHCYLCNRRILTSSTKLGKILLSISGSRQLFPERKCYQLYQVPRRYLRNSCYHPYPQAPLFPQRHRFQPPQRLHINAHRPPHLRRIPLCLLLLRNVLFVVLYEPRILPHHVLQRLASRCPARQRLQRLQLGGFLRRQPDGECRYLLTAHEPPPPCSSVLPG